MTRRAKITAGVAGLAAAALAVPFACQGPDVAGGPLPGPLRGLTQGSGKIDAFVGSTPTAAATITCNQSSTSAADFATDLAAISNGQTLCLTNAVSYGTFTGTSKTITIIAQAASGAANPVNATMTSINFGSGDSGFTLDGGVADIRNDASPGLTITGGDVTTGASNITVKNFKMTGCGSAGCRVFTADPAPVDSNILFTHFNVHDVQGGEAVFYIDDTAGTSSTREDTGLTFQNGYIHHLSNDGFKLTGNDTVRVYNVWITDSHESNGSDGNHTDGIQMLEANHVLRGNVIMDCDQAIFADDGTGNNDITHNAIVDCGEHWITVGGDGSGGIGVGNGPGSRIKNNTLVASTGFSVFIPPNITCGNNAVTNGFGDTLGTSTTTLIDNIAREIDLAGTGGGITCAPAANHHNLLNTGQSTTGTGGSNFTGTTPSFAGGSDASTFDSLSDFCAPGGASWLTGASVSDPFGTSQPGVCGGDYNSSTDGPPAA